MFRTVPLSIIRSFSLYIQQWYMSYRFADSLRTGSGRIHPYPDQLASRIRTDPSWSCSQAVSKPVRHIPLVCVQWKTPDDGRRNCPKHVELYSKNKFEKLVHLIGFIIRICHDARSPERQIKPRNLTSALDGGKLSSSRPSHLTPSYVLTGTRWIGRWGSPSACPDVSERG